MKVGDAFFKGGAGPRIGPACREWDLGIRYYTQNQKIHGSNSSSFGTQPRYEAASAFGLN